MGKPGRGNGETGLLELARRYLEEGWRLRVKRVKGRLYLTARRTEGGRRREVSLGAIGSEEELERLRSLVEAAGRVSPRGNLGKRGNKGAGKPGKRRDGETVGKQSHGGAERRGLGGFSDEELLDEMSRRGYYCFRKGDFAALARALAEWERAREELRAWLRGEAAPSRVDSKVESKVESTGGRRASRRQVSTSGTYKCIECGAELRGEQAALRHYREKHAGKGRKA